MKPDYRTWWREGHNVYMILRKAHNRLPDFIDEPIVNSTLLFRPFSYAESDVIAEQLWAMREGLA